MNERPGNEPPAMRRLRVLEQKVKDSFRNPQPIPGRSPRIRLSQISNGLSRQHTVQMRLVNRKISAISRELDGELDKLKGDPPNFSKKILSLMRKKLALERHILWLEMIRAQNHFYYTVFDDIAAKKGIKADKTIDTWIAFRKDISALEKRRETLFDTIRSPNELRKKVLALHQLLWRKK